MKIIKQHHRYQAYLVREVVSADISRKPSFRRVLGERWRPNGELCVTWKLDDILVFYVLLETSYPKILITLFNKNLYPYHKVASQNNERSD